MIAAQSCIGLTPDSLLLQSPNSKQLIEKASNRMSEELVATAAKEGSLVPSEFGAMTSKYGDEKAFAGMSGSSFLPRMQLMTGSSRPVMKNQSKMGHYVLFKGKDAIVRDFGDSFNCIPLSWRPKALHFIGDKAHVYFNPRTPKFVEVEKLAEKKPRVKGAMYGPEYLIYIPDVDEVATFHFSNVTMRMRAGEFKALLTQAATVRSEIIDKNGFIWPGPLFGPCNTLVMPQGDALTALHERWRALLEKFNNPPDEDTSEEVTDEAVPAGGEARER